MSQIKIINTFRLVLAYALALSYLLHGHIASAQDLKTSGPFSAETVLLTTDRTIYLSGETIYLSATILESDDFISSGLSRVCRVELLDSKGITGVREILASDEGRIAGSIKLPDNLPTGWYRLRAYTSWMRNRGPSLFSYRDIRIFNPSDAASLGEASRGDTLIVALIAPEGEALSGAINRCAVRSKSLRGRTVAVKGSLVSSDKDTVAHFSCGTTGWGSLEWTPLAGKRYRIVLESDPGMPVLTEVPRHSDRAISVYVDDPLPSGDDPGKDRNITVSIAGNIGREGIKMLVHRISNWYIFSEALPGNDRLSFLISTADLPDGLMAFSFLDNDNRVLASVLWIKGNPLSEGGSVMTKAGSAKDAGSLLTEYSTGPAGSGGFYTLTIRRREPAEAAGRYTGAIKGWPSTWEIPADMNERKGWLLAAQYDNAVAEAFFEKKGSKPLEPVLNFNDVKDTRQSMVEYMPETRGMKLSGTLRYEDGRPAALHKLSLTGLNDNIFLTARTFPDGRFHFAFPGRTGSKDLILSHVTRPAEKMEIEVGSEYDPRISGLPPAGVYLTDEEADYVDTLIIDSRLEYIYRDTAAKTPALDSPGPTGRTMFYGNPDHVVYIDRYIKLPDMRELIFEIVPFVSVRKEGDDYSLKVISENPYPASYDPLILTDGIPLLSFNRFLDLPPDRFKRIDILNSVYIHGNQVFSGVVNFISVNGDLAGLDLPGGSRIITLDIPGPSPEGDLVRGGNSLPGIPSLGRTLSFVPFISEGKGSFSCTANPAGGTYTTVLTGLDEEGRWFSLSFDFEAGMPGLR